MKRFSVILLFFILAVGHSGLAQDRDPAVLDSLEEVLPKMKEDTAKVKLLDELNTAYRDTKPDLSLKYGQEELDLATKLKWKNGIKIAASNLALVYEDKTDYPKALEYYLRALKISEGSTDKSGTVDLEISIGHIYEQESDPRNALDYYSRAMVLVEQTGDKNKIAALNGNLGAIYNETGDYPNALLYYQKALKGHIERDDKVNFAISETNIGNVYFNEGNYPKALEYHFKALKLYQELWQKISVAYEYQIIGNIYIEMESYPTAIHYEQMGLKIAEETDNKVLAGYVLATIGNAYVLLVKDETGAGNAMHQNPGETDQNKYGERLPKSKSARLRRAINYLLRGLSLGEKMQINQLIQYCDETLIDAYKLNGDFKKAIEYTNNYHAMIDSVFSKRNKEKLLMVNLKHQYENQHLTDSFRTLNQEKQEKITALKLKRQTTYLLVAIGFSIFVLIIISLIYFNYVRVRALHKKVSIQKAELEKSNRDKERILQIVAHDLRSPVGSIAYISDLIMMGDRSEKEVMESIKMIKNASLGSLDLINELIGQMDNARSPEKKPENICELIQECAAMMNFKAKEKQQTIVCDVPAAPLIIPVNHEKIMRVLNNLIGNAIKFSNEKQMIGVSVDDGASDVVIRVRDEGIGIPESMKKEVFDIFTESKRYGTLGEKPFGLGLYISRQIVEAHGGSIGFESTEGVETIFYIRLPKNSGQQN